MHYIGIDKLNSGDILARTITGNSASLMLIKGVVLTDALIVRMKNHGINIVCIEDNLDTVDTNDIIPPSLRAEAVESLKNVTLLLKNIVKPHGNFVSVLENIITAIIHELTGNNKNLASMLDLKTHDNYTFEHSVNVAVLSLMTGMAMGYDYSKLKNVGIGALLHDIGKTLIPIEILNNEGKLTADEFGLIKKHPMLGYEKSKLALDIDPTGRSIILQHHEKINGTGYPFGKTETTIHEYAKIVAISDIYDALTSDRPYRKRWPIKEALDLMTSICNTHIDVRIFNLFLSRISPYPPGIKVSVSNGKFGYVLNNENRLRPLIGFTDGTVLDLSKEGNFYIREIVD